MPTPRFTNGHGSPPDGFAVSAPLDRVEDDTPRVRDATANDLPALTRMKETAALHRDRLRDAQSPTLRYLVLEQASGNVIGFACLVFAQPASWPDAHDPSHHPQIVDLHIAPAFRGRGYGSYLLLALEQFAAQRGCESIFIGVDPIHNARAHALYRRLGYRQLQSEPYRKHWEFVDSEGTLHAGDGDDWMVDMVKPL